MLSGGWDNTVQIWDLRACKFIILHISYLSYSISYSHYFSLPHTPLLLLIWKYLLSLAMEYNFISAKAVRSLFGPHICGNSLDICGTYDHYCYVFTLIQLRYYYLTVYEIYHYISFCP